MRILGIDPGIATIGFGVVNAEGTRLRMESYGTITTPAGLPLATRLLQIETDMEQLLRDVKPDEVSIEELFFSKNITTGIAVAERAAASSSVRLRRCSCRSMNTRPCRSSRPSWGTVWPKSVR